MWWLSLCHPNQPKLNRYSSGDDDCKLIRFIPVHLFCNAILLSAFHPEGYSFAPSYPLRGHISSSLEHSWTSPMHVTHFLVYSNMYWGFAWGVPNSYSHNDPFGPCGSIHAILWWLRENVLFLEFLNSLLPRDANGHDFLLTASKWFISKRFH